LLGDRETLSAGPANKALQLVWERGRVLTKGSYVMVQGAVRTREYERDGVTHLVVEVRADTVGKLDRRAEAEGEPDASDA
jgi:single-stranded DNA-binding protein